MTSIFWTGYSNNKRHSAIDEIKRVVANYGDIVDFKFFSDISLAIIIEIEEFKIDNLYIELTDHLGMDKFEYLRSISRKERKVYLNITFTQGSGNLIIETPCET